MAGSYLWTDRCYFMNGRTAYMKEWMDLIYEWADIYEWTEVIL